MKLLSKLKKQNLAKDVVLLRLDLNVKSWSDAFRLEAAAPTLKWLLERNARVLIVSHRGRPDPTKGFDPAFTLEAAATFLEKRIGTLVKFIPLADFSGVKKMLAAAAPKAVFLLENIRFLAGEETNSAKLARRLASLGTMYVNDAFGVSHRKNASVAAITKYLPSYVGLELEREYATLSAVMKSAEHPLVFILGGEKTADKMGMIKQFWKKADVFLLGGGIANTALAATGVDIKASVHDPTLVGFGKKLMKSPRALIPQDWVWSQNNRIVDIGPKTIRQFSEKIAGAKTIIWNGPLGVIEDPHFAAGSVAIAKAIAKSGAFSVVGGGETTELILSLCLQKKISFLSTGGGAMLEFLAGKNLPGLEALK